MANKRLFQALPKSMVVNEAGGIAYKLPPKAALAQYVSTGCLNDTFYADSAAQLNTILDLCSKVPPEFVAKVALYGRKFGYMKDVPALLCVYLSAKKENALLQKIFSRVINNGKMLRNFVQITRSGITGKRSVGGHYYVKKFISNWFNSRTDKEVFSQSIGNDPSFADIIKLSHIKPLTDERNALHQWFLGIKYNPNHLPEIVKQFEDFKSGASKDIPDVPFEMLTALPLTTSQWCQIALQAGWQWTRMNLNTMHRQGVLSVPEAAKIITERLGDREQVKKAHAMPYQIMAAILNAQATTPDIDAALEQALEYATENVPSLSGNGFICMDISGSMGHPVTGYRRGATSKVRCIDVAALIASALLRKNQESRLLPFNTKVVNTGVNPNNKVMHNARELSGLLDGGTDCSSPLRLLNEDGARGDWVFMVSDNQSWAHMRDHLRLSHDYTYEFTQQRSPTMKEWLNFKERNPQAKLVCLDIQPATHALAPEGEDILNCGGFSDEIFKLVSAFFHGHLSANHWTDAIESIEI